MEYPTKQDKAKGRARLGELGDHNGNCLAILLREDGIPKYRIELDQAVFAGIGAIYFEPDSPATYTAVGEYFLRTRCKRVSEEIARQVHPKLFEYLEG